MLALTLLLAAIATAQSNASGATVSTAALDREIREFFDREMSAHMADIQSLNPPPPRVVGALTTGDFSWGTFMRALAEYEQLSGNRALAGRDIAATIGQIGLIESRNGGKTFAQMYGAMSITSFGTELERNAVWQSLNAEEKAAWTSLLDPGRFYDRQNHRVINLPDNYLGVASRVATLSYRLGIITERSYVDDILNTAAARFVRGDLFSDDSVPSGRFDRYSQEYARYTYEAAETMDRRDIQQAMESSLKAQMRLWWDLISPDGYGYPWGRSVGEIGYMDTMEIVAFLAAHPQFRPAPLPQLAAAYAAAWRFLRHDYQDSRHLLDTFGFGNGHYSYISKQREWQQTTGFLGKVMGAHIAFMRVAASEQLSSFPATPQLANVARFQFFRQTDRPAGVWLVRQTTTSGLLHFALPIISGTKSAMADYLPAPHGFPGFGAPVEQPWPALVPFVELEDGRVMVAGDAADEIRPAPDGRSVAATWRRWAQVGGKAGEVTDIGLRSDVKWTLNGNIIRREEKLTAAKIINIRRWWMAVPSQYPKLETSSERGVVFADFSDRERGAFAFALLASPPSLRISSLASRDEVIGRGAQGSIPMHLILESRNLTLQPSKPISFIYELRFAEKNPTTASSNAVR